MRNGDLFSNFHMHVTEEFFEEFTDIVDKSADRDLVYEKMIPLLQQMSMTPINYLCQSKHFEKLKHSKDLYAMRVQTNALNLRMLFTVRKDGKVF